MPVGAGARGAADAVDVAFRDVRQIVIEDMGDAVDVDAAGGDVGRDQDAHAGRRGSRRARARAGSATCCRGWRRRRMPDCSRLRTTRSAPCLVRVKTSARSIVSALHQSRRAARACRAGRHARCADRCARRCWRPGVTATRTGSFSSCATRLVDLAAAWSPRRTASGARRQLRDDFADVVDEAHVEHAVGFVEHETSRACRARPRSCCRRSSRRPGVATRTSTPFESERI